MPITGRRGFALLYVIIILFVLFTLSFVLIQSMRQESDQSFRSLEKTVAVYAAECGIEHGIYILQYHRNSDHPVFSSTGGSGGSLTINSRFATEDSFTMSLPLTAPDDARFPDLAAIDLNTEVQALASTRGMEFVPSVESIELDYKTLSTVDNSPERLLKYGALTIRCTASCNRTRVTVESKRRLEIYRTLSIEPDWQFVTLAPTEQKIPARRKYSSSSFLAQYLMVQNGRDAAGNAIPSKIYGENLLVDFNNFQENFNLLFPINPASLIVKLFNDSSDTLCKMGSDTYQGNWIDPAHDSHTDSPLIKYQAHRTALGNFSNLKGYLSEWDATDSFLDDLIDALNPFATGGSRGSIDLTGLPVESTSLPGLLTDFLGSLFGNQTQYTLNSINGNIRRHYGYVKHSEDDDGLFTTLWNAATSIFTSDDTIVVSDEPYLFAIGNDRPTNPRPYDLEVYRRLASHGNGRLFDTPEAFSDHRMSAGSLLFWDDIGGKDYTNVCWFWGWADSYKDEPSDSWWKFWKWGTRNAFEAARRDPQHAINVNGSYFVDGNVYIEGYYRGRGAIVATGNIIIGGALMRHPDDGMITTSAADWLSEGPNNMLQLIALGTRPGDGDKPTGKIIYSPHKYPGRMFETGIFGSIFKDSKQIRVDANLWAKNGVTVETSDRDNADSWSIWGEEDSVITVNGNVICDNLEWEESGAFRTWPDRLIIARFQPWCSIIDYMKANNNVMLNLFPQPDQYRILRED